jgi:hypothetical protein
MKASRSGSGNKRKRAKETWFNTSDQLTSKCKQMVFPKSDSCSNSSKMHFALDAKKSFPELNTSLMILASFVQSDNADIVVM